MQRCASPFYYLQMPCKFPLSIFTFCFLAAGVTDKAANNTKSDSDRQVSSAQRNKNSFSVSVTCSNNVVSRFSIFSSSKLIISKNSCRNLPEQVILIPTLVSRIHSREDGFRQLLSRFFWNNQPIQAIKLKRHKLMAMRTFQDYRIASCHFC